MHPRGGQARILPIQRVAGKLKNSYKKQLTKLTQKEIESLTSPITN